MGGGGSNGGVRDGSNPNGVLIVDGNNTPLLTVTGSASTGYFTAGDSALPDVELFLQFAEEALDNLGDHYPVETHDSCDSCLLAHALTTIHQLANLVQL